MADIRKTYNKITHTHANKGFMETNKNGHMRVAYSPIKPVSQEERAALEQCDKILEALQDYMRGACSVKIIRNHIKNRLTGFA